MAEEMELPFEEAQPAAPKKRAAKKSTGKRKKFAADTTEAQTAAAPAARKPRTPAPASMKRQHLTAVAALKAAEKLGKSFHAAKEKAKLLEKKEALKEIVQTIKSAKAEIKSYAKQTAAAEKVLDKAHKKYESLTGEVYSE